MNEWMNCDFLNTIIRQVSIQKWNFAHYANHFFLLLLFSYLSSVIKQDNKKQLTEEGATE